MNNVVLEVKCKKCGEMLKDTDPSTWFEEYGEELLWAHIQRRHEELFEELMERETPVMIEECYDITAFNP